MIFITLYQGKYIILPTPFEFRMYYWISLITTLMKNNQSILVNTTVYITIQPNSSVLLYLTDFQVKSKIPLY